MNEAPTAPLIASVAEFYAQALAIEEEASARYVELADQMEVHNNSEVATLFRKMAEVESEHRDEIARRAGDALVKGRPASFSWIRGEGPETTDFADAHYLMTPYHALVLARINEERAEAFFSDVAATATDPQVQALARQMAEEEREHVEWVDQWLARFPKPECAWDDDPDPPVYSD